MSTSNLKRLSNPSIITGNNPIVIKLNQHISFTSVQIEELFRLQLLNKGPAHICVPLVSSVLKLDNVKENNINLWLADTFALVVKDIQRTHMTLIQGIVVMFWVIHYMSLVIEKKFSKVDLFENLRECLKVGLANADQLIIPLPNCTECPKYQHLMSKPNSLISLMKSVHNVPVETVATFIIDTMSTIFWDDFKYTVIQMAFNTKHLEARKTKFSFKDNRESNDNDRIVVCKDSEENHKRYAIMDRYFFRGLKNNNNNMESTTGVQKILCTRLSARSQC